MEQQADKRTGVHLLQGRLIIGRDILVGINRDHMALLLGDVAHAVLCLVLVILFSVNASIPAATTTSISTRWNHHTAHTWSATWHDITTSMYDCRKMAMHGVGRAIVMQRFSHPWTCAWGKHTSLPHRRSYSGRLLWHVSVGTYSEQECRCTG